LGEDETDRQDAAPPPVGGQTDETGLVAPADPESQRRADLGLFVSANLEKFYALFGLRDGRRRRLVCWPGFFFPPAWFMYRKMYGWAALACALPIFAGVLDFGVFQRVLIGAPSFIGLAGRRIYVAEARKTIARVRAAGQGRPEEEVRQTLARAGGVSTAGAVVGGAIVFCAAVAGFVAGYKAHLH